MKGRREWGGGVRLQNGGVISYKTQNLNNLVLILRSCIKRSFIISSRHGSAGMHTEFRWGNLKGSNCFEDVAVGGKIILKQNLRTLNGMTYTGFM